VEPASHAVSLVSVSQMIDSTKVLSTVDDPKVGSLHSLGGGEVLSGRAGL
jgi:hypothetical protein